MCLYVMFLLFSVQPHYSSISVTEHKSEPRKRRRNKTKSVVITFCCCSRCIFLFIFLFLFPLKDYVHFHTKYTFLLSLLTHMHVLHESHSLLFWETGRHPFHVHRRRKNEDIIHQHQQQQSILPFSYSQDPLSMNMLPKLKSN